MLLKVGVAVAIAKNKTTVKFVASIDSSFHDDFSLACDAGLRAFHHSVEFLSKLASVLSNPAAVP